MVLELDKGGGSWGRLINPYADPRHPLFTCEISQHGCECDGQQDQADAEALPGAPVLAPLVYVEPGRGVGGVVGVVRRGGRSQRKNRHDEGRLLRTCLQRGASRRHLLVQLALLQP